jgi:DNA-binding IscR family transcriptional regulator
MMLAVDAKTTTLLGIVEAVDGPLVPSEFVQKNAELAEIGSFDCIWAEIELLVRSYLGSVTLYQVVVEGLAPALRSGYVFEAIPAKELAAMREAKE